MQPISIATVPAVPVLPRRFKMSEKLTRDLIETHLMSCINIHSAEQKDGVIRFAWELVMRKAPQDEIEEHEFDHRFSSHEAAKNYAFGWIRRNRPDLEKAAVQEAKDGIHYRASRS
jgi:hypothetical protein